MVSAYDSTGLWVRGEVYAAGSHLATYTSGTSGPTRFSLNDWLGTERVRTGPAGGVTQKCKSLAFGDGFSCTGTDMSPLHFTGQEHDTESNLEHFWFRQYSSVQGNWMSPDPAGLAAGDPINPQSWNRYAYVESNPVSITDPLGLFLNTPFWWVFIWEGGPFQTWDNMV